MGSRERGVMAWCMCGRFACGWTCWLRAGGSEPCCAGYWWLWPVCMVPWSWVAALAILTVGLGGNLIGRTDMKVVSWKSPSGETVDVCQDCELRLAGRWPRDQKGEEYCSVSRGLHHGECEVHKLGLDEMTTYSLTRGGSWMGAGSADGGDCWGWRASNGDGSGCYWLL